MDTLRDFYERAVGWFMLQILRRRPGYSTGICGSLTAGFGRLDHNGYWQYPVRPTEGT